MSRIGSTALAAPLALALLLTGTEAGARHRSSTWMVAFPGKTWSLAVDLSGFNMEPLRRTADGVMAKGKNGKSGLVVSIFLERAVRDGDARACRKYYWKRARKSPMPKSDILLSEREDMALVEYVIPEFAGVTINQKNYNAYMAYDGIWMDIHLSKTAFGTQDIPLFEAVLESVRIEPGGPTRRAATRP